MHKLAKAIQWREDVADSEMIEAPGYTKEYMDFRDEYPATQLELDAICEAINLYYKMMLLPFRVYNADGKLRPVCSVREDLEWIK